MAKECIALDTPMENKGIITIYRSPWIFFTTSNSKRNSEDIRSGFEKCYEFSDPVEKKYIFTEPHKDYWSSEDSGETYFSIMRPLTATYRKGDTIATIELDEKYSKIEDICRSNSSMEKISSVIMDTSTGKLIYPAGTYDEKETAHFLQLQDMQPEEIRKIRDGSGNSMFVNVRRSGESDWMILAIQPASLYLQPISSLSLLIAIILALSVVMMIILFSFVSYRLTIPVRNLREAVKHVTIENVSIEMNASGNDEIAALQQAFSDLLTRLRVSADNLAVSRTAEYESRILALQAQINPHFLYNALMAISAAGMENGNRKVELMCGQLSDLFRYAADSQQGSTIGSEVDNTKIYLDFMKIRYQDTVEFSFDVPAELYDIRVPRLSLQPIIENCFSYAIHTILPPLIIRIRGYVGQNVWKMEIEDNGTGIDEAGMQELLDLLEKTGKNITDRRFGEDLDVDGKALINIYARLKLKYGDQCIFLLENLSPRGFRVTIGGPVSPVSAG